MTSGIFGLKLLLLHAHIKLNFANDNLVPEVKMTMHIGFVNLSPAGTIYL